LAESIEFSVVVPVRDEAGNAAALAREIAKALDGRSYEMIFVDDASRDDTRAELAALKAELPTLRLIGHRKNSGQSRAVRTGVLAARAPVVGTLDGDGQNDPADLPRLLARLVRADAPPELAVSAPLPGADWPALAAIRDGSRALGVEGLMLKDWDSPYGAGRQRGAWWKWKIDPLTFDGVLLYAAAGHGRLPGTARGGGVRWLPRHVALRRAELLLVGGQGAQGVFRFHPR